jgi:hypothetical protein
MSQAGTPFTRYRSRISNRSDSRGTVARDAQLAALTPKNGINPNRQLLVRLLNRKEADPVPEVIRARSQRRRNSSCDSQRRCGKERGATYTTWFPNRHSRASENYMITTR